MNGNRLLDTNIIIGLFAHDESIERRLSEDFRVLLSATVLGELYYGAFKSTKTEENVARLQQFAAVAGIVPCDAETSRFYGRIKQDLRKKGRPLPENDIWIAALALQHSVVLVSRDDHFAEIDGLAWERW